MRRTWYQLTLAETVKLGLLYITTVAFVASLFVRLIWPNALGLADNHDYWRLMKPFDLVYPAGAEYSFFQFLQTDFLREYQGTGEPLSSGLLFVGIAYLISFVIHNHIFSLLLLGGVHVLGYGLGFYLLLRFFMVKSLKQFCGFSLVAVYILSSLVFTPYFVSFYQESAVLIFLLLFVGLYLRKNGNFFIEAGILILLILTKVPSTIFALLAVPVLVKYRNVSRLWLKSSLVILAVIVAVCFNLLNDDETAQPNIFNSFFKGMVATDNAADVLRDFSLSDERYLTFVGKDFWTVSFPTDLQADFYQKANRIQIGMYYLTHPGLFISRLYSASMLLVSDIRPDNLGNRTAEFSSTMVIADEPLWGWQYLLQLLVLPGMLFSIAQLIYMFLYVRKTELVLLLMTLTVLLPLLVVTVLLGDGWHEFAKHNLPFYFVFSLWFLLSVHFWYNHFAAKRL